VRDSIQQQGDDIDQEALAKLLNLLRYVGGDYQEPATFDLLKKTLGSASRPAHYLGDSAQSFYKCCRVSRKVELHASTTRGPQMNVALQCRGQTSC
jgi:glucose-6-phosphate 1-dehydrogenase